MCILALLTGFVLIFFFFYCLWNSWLKDISFFDGWWPDTSALVAEDVRVSGFYTHSVLWPDWPAWWSSFVCSGAEQALQRLVPHYLVSALHIQAPTICSAVRFYWLWMALDLLLAHNMVLQRPQMCVVCFVWSELSFSLFQMHLLILRWVSDVLCKRLLWDGMDPFISRLHNHALWYVTIILDTKVIVYNSVSQSSLLARSGSYKFSFLNWSQSWFIWDDTVA